MENRKILFLGGAFSQIPAIEYAIQQGYHVITVDYLPENPGHKISDEYYNISTIDVENVFSISKKLNIDAVSAYASDPAAPTAAFISERMGLVGSSYESVNVLSNKILFRKFLKVSGFKVPWVIYGKSLDEIYNKYNGEEAILKPVDSSGSKGIYKINQHKDLSEYFEKAKIFSRSGEVILEKYIQKKGPQIHGEAFAINGNVIFMLLGDQIFSGKDALIPYSTLVPSINHLDVMEKVHELVKNAIKASGFNTGGLNIEVIRDESDNLYLLEIGARNGGNFMPQLMKYATGFDLVRANIDALFNKKIDLPDNNYVKNKKYHAQIILHSKKNGIFNGINIPHELETCVLEKNIYYKRGEVISKYQSSKDVVGVLILELDSVNLKNYYQYLENNNWVEVI